VSAWLHRSGSKQVHYAWVIVAVTFAVAVITAGVRSTPGVLIVPLEGNSVVTGDDFLRAWR
jgi:hypothetical protein